MAIVGQFHVLGEVETLDGGDVADIEEPDVSEDLAFKDKPCDSPAENINVDLQVGSRIDQSELGTIRLDVGSGS
jgi:hypothetical protein